MQVGFCSYIDAVLVWSKTTNTNTYGKSLEATSDIVCQFVKLNTFGQVQYTTHTVPNQPNVTHGTKGILD